MSRPGGTKFFLRGRESIFCTVGQREDEKDSAPFLQIARFNDLDVHVLAYSQMNCINGLFCIWDPLSIRPAAIFNPSTREVRFLPNIKEEFCPCNYSLGFEPEEKKFKVFCSTYERNKQRQCVFTLGIDKSWRETQSISFSIPYSKPSVCVSGVIYQFIDGGAIAAIDVKSEKSETIALWNALRESMYYYELIEVNGKLMVIDYRQWVIGYLDLWILEQTPKRKWERHIIRFPSTWNDILVLQSSKSYLQITSLRKVSDADILFTLNLNPGVLCLCYDVTRKSWKELKIKALPKESYIYGIYSYVERLSM
uniref:F-box protein n=1 Tax=Solanum tuberosum TaxID=4113 RepID=M1DPQ4_SOLTU